MSRASMATPESLCKQAAGVLAPVVNLKRCEGKGDCAVVCPEDVFEIRREVIEHWLLRRANVPKDFRHTQLTH